eukprot:scaffold30140_cov55-Attheya_sp.AAC.7
MVAGKWILLSPVVSRDAANSVLFFLSGFVEESHVSIRRNPTISGTYLGYRTMSHLQSHHDR